VLDRGEAIVQETRSFDADEGVTRPLRSKEEAHDYRYFPEPDLGPLVLEAERVENLRADLPELPWERRARFVERYGVPLADARVLTARRELADYFERAVAAHPANAKSVANWVRGPLLAALKERKADLGGAPPAERLAAVVALVDGGTVSNTAAKDVLMAVWDSDESPRAAAERLGLLQVSDSSQIDDWVRAVIEENPGPVGQVRAGKTQTMGFLVGQVMKRSAGRAEPRQVQEALKRALDAL
jgi:aspartyl-tRNA(Asn)/glutamyl-tRNA(Gln) amidotransferase subunit B